MYAGLVHVDAGAHPADALKETEWLQGITDARGMPNAIVAFAPLDDPKVETLLAAHAAHGNVRGIRHIANWHGDAARSYTPRDLTGDAQWQAGYARLKTYGLSFDCQIYPGQMPAMAALAARHPQTPVIINHLGMPVPGDPDGVGAWRAGLKKLAALPHVSIKLSGCGLHSARLERGDNPPLPADRH